MLNRVTSLRVVVVVVGLSVGCAEGGGGPGPAGGAGTTGGGGGGTTGSAGSGSAGTTGGGGAGTTGGSGGGAGATGVGGGVTTGAAGTGGMGGAGGGGVRDGWPTYDQAAAAPLSTPVLIILTDFMNSDINSYLPNAEPAWSELMFGRNQGQGNNYWYEVSTGKFQILKARESFGQADNGVVHVHLPAMKPTSTSGTFLVQAQPWIPQALDAAAAYVRFADYDKDGNGRISNNELTVMIVLNLDYMNINGAGAEANIPIDHAIGGNGVVIERFLRVEDDYTSIGTPCHELGHHILGLKHAPAPTEHDLMGLGAYAEDPVITRLHLGDHYATRPAGLTGINKVLAGFLTATTITDTTLGLQLHSPQSKDYNVIKLPIVDGFLYLDNRTAEGYDQSIPFCTGHTGGLFGTESSQYQMPLNMPAIAARAAAFSFDIPDEIFCDFYGLRGHNDSFTLGQYTISNVSAPGRVMTLDITRNNVTPAISNYKWRYWVNNPAMAGYRMWRNVTAAANTPTDIDVRTFPSGTDPAGYFTINLESYFNTGEVRSVNADATWTSTSSYVVVSVNPIFNPGATRGDAIIRLQFNTAVARPATAIVNVTHQGFSTSFRLTNIP